ncbi:site-specific DNA-methyltransferase [Pseudomonas kairouanensis]|uniref:Methyltransferase n=1 Tax=Pseudomonas kairouanensis TaxID=2293832 RepID=A0A4Z0AKK2_9PSED|nr:site-specific DNA-methyltransferase [Pseudomonas kairouanensis]TFY86709.1 site-specific DNA-methyltransferase [Pseudomonas kairouanensis]
MKQHRVLIGDCIESMRTLQDQSINTCVTSPPYFGLRDYGMAGQIGLEETPAEFVSRLVDVFREVKRVLRDDGTLWLNLGDSYCSTAPGTKNAPQSKGSAKNPEQWANARPKTPPGLKPKDLIGIPWLVAFALQADGWFLRQDIIWQKPNPMPESVTDRCTKSHEYIFLLSKSQRYHFDHVAIKEEAIGGQTGNATTFKREGSKREKSIPGHAYGTHRPDRKEAHYSGEKRNRRSVWSVATRPFKGAHFATFPTDLIRPCILAGAPVGGVVLDPFGGAGTTAVVAMQEGRKSILCELNPEYAAMAERRIAASWLDGSAQMDVFQDTAQHPAA